MKRYCLLLLFLSLFVKNHSNGSGLSDFPGSYYPAGNYFLIGPESADFFVAKDKKGEPAAILMVRPRITNYMTNIIKASFLKMPVNYDLISMELYPQMKGGHFSGFLLDEVKAYSPNGILCIEKNSSLFGELSSITDKMKYDMLMGTIDYFKFPLHLVFYYDPNYKPDWVWWKARNVEKNERERRAKLLLKLLDDYGLHNLNINISPYYEQLPL